MSNNEKRNQESMDTARGSNLDYGKIGTQIRVARQNKGLTQEMLAQQADCSAAFISNLERGMKCASVDMLVELAMCLDVTVDQFLRGNQSADEVTYAREIHGLLEKYPPEEWEFIFDLTALVKEMFDRYSKSPRGKSK